MNEIRLSIFKIAFPCTLVFAGCAMEPGSQVDASAEALTRADEPQDSLGRKLGAISAAIVKANEEAARSFNLVARLEVQPNELLEFYEPTPGVIIEMSAGAPEATRRSARSAAANVTGAAPEETWNALTNNARMPAALAEAVDRRRTRSGSAGRRNARPAPEKRNRAAGGEAPADLPDDAAIDGSSEFGPAAHIGLGWCDSEYYSHQLSTWGWPLGGCGNELTNFEICLDHKTGGGSSSHDEIINLNANVCPYRGNVDWSISGDEDWVNQGTWTVHQNTFRAYRATDEGICDTWFDDCVQIRTTVSNATNDGYQRRFVAWVD